MDKIKVLMCAFACDPKASSGLGGGEDILGWNIINQVAKFCDVWVLCSVKNKSNVDNYLKNSSIGNAHFYYVDLPRWMSAPLWFVWSEGGSQFYSYLWQIKIYFIAKKLHKKINFDLFHHVTYANDWMASFAGALLNIPYVRGPGGGAHKTPKKFMSEYSAKQKLWQYIRSFNQWIFRHDPFFILGRRKAGAILVCNEEALRVIPKNFIKKTRLFPVTGISKKDFDVIKNSTARKDGEKFVILSAGKLFPIKGFNLAIKAFKIFIDKNPGAEFVIAGDGPELHNLKNLVDSLGINDKVIFKGQLARENLLKEMASADVFLFSSLRDGGGAVVVEAMGAGLPVVCLGIAGPALHVDDTCGIKIIPDFPEQAVQDMAQALEKLYSNKELRERLGEGAKEKAEKEYSWDKLGERLQKTYKEIL